MPEMADLQSNYVRKQLQGTKPQGEMMHAGQRFNYNGFYKNIIISSITIITIVTDISPNYGLISLINNISFSLPASPLLTQFRDIPPSKLCNSCDQQFCECTYLIKIPLGSVVEILMVNTRKL